MNSQDYSFSQPYLIKSLISPVSIKLSVQQFSVASPYLFSRWNPSDVSCDQLPRPPGRAESNYPLSSQYHQYHPLTVRKWRALIGPELRQYGCVDQ